MNSLDHAVTQSAGLVFSVVIPTFNRPAALARCLASLTRQDYSKDRFEVIVIDDGSHPPLDASLVRCFPLLNLRLRRQTNAGPAAARNLGALLARGRLLAFTDDDCEPDAGWLALLEHGLNRHPGSLVGGRTINGLVDNSFSAASQLLIDFLYECGLAGAVREPFFASNNIALEHSEYSALGGFSAHYMKAAAEDREFCRRWIRTGRPLVFVSEATVRHSHPLTLHTFLNQHFGYGRGAYHFHRSHQPCPLILPPVEPISFYFKLLTYPWRFRGGHRRWWISSCLALSQVAGLIGYVSERLGALLQLPASDPGPSS
jgi:glycosyltransferase involved in cell wall biosynthesis